MGEGAPLLEDGEHGIVYDDRPSSVERADELGVCTSYSFNPSLLSALFQATSLPSPPALFSICRSSEEEVMGHSTPLYSTSYSDSHKLRKGSSASGQLDSGAVTVEMID